MKTLYLDKWDNYSSDAPERQEAIAGGLAGAIYGYRNIPTRWIQTLGPEVKKELDRLAEVATKNREEQ